MLSQCKIPYPKVAYDDEFGRLTRVELERRGCALSGPYGVAQFIPPSVSMATVPYGHCTKDVQMFICIYSALLFYVDDKFEKDVEGLRDFNRRFIRGQKQRDPTLECLAQLIHEIPDLYGPIVSDIITTSTLNGITAVSLECETRGLPVSLSYLQELSLIHVTVDCVRCLRVSIIHPSPLRCRRSVFHVCVPTRVAIEQFHPKYS
jgi:hypothetical protein